MFKNPDQYVPSEVCLSCDGCCRFKEKTSPWRPRVAVEEVGLAGHIFTREALDHDKRITTVRCHDGIHQCRFFSTEGNVCTIYAYRPFECQLYPFILMRQQKGVVLTVHLNCPHIQETGHLPKFDEYVAYLKGFFQQNDVRGFLQHNASLIDEYTDYKDELRELFPVTF